MPGNGRNGGPRRRKPGIALCLSGGGFRAALFHLGSLRRLNELGLLSKVVAISSVSGGSVLSAYLARTLPEWPTGTMPNEEWERKVAAPFRAFAQSDLRTHPLLKRLWPPTNWGKSDVGVRALADAYRRRLNSSKLTQLPDRPRYTFCAAEMGFGVNWIFEKHRAGNYQLGYATPPPPEWDVALAVAASSCFPLAFDSMRLSVDPEKLAGGKAERSPHWKAALSDLRLTDGGVYDNLGLEPVWKEYETVLVSDGGSPFKVKPNRNTLGRYYRFVTLQERQVRALRKRMLHNDRHDGEYVASDWGLTNVAIGETAQAYRADVVDGLIATLRTDFDAFSEAECFVLENHGYSVVDAQIRREALGLLRGPVPPAQVPHPAAMAPEYVRLHLADGARLKIVPSIERAVVGQDYEWLPNP